MALTPTEAVLSRTRGRTGVFAGIIVALSILLVLTHVYTATFTQMTPFVQRHFVGTLILVIGILLFPLGRKGWAGPIGKAFIIDLLLIGMSVFPLLLVLADSDHWVLGITNLTTLELISGTLFMVAVIEVTRRVIGWPLVAIALFFLAQNHFAEYLPDPLFGASVSWPHQVLITYTGTMALFGVPIAVITNYLIVFFLFAAILKVCVAGEIFMDLAFALAGRFSGGPAKVAVVSSALFGTISGSPMANVMATGSFNIPMMKKMGFKSHVAGAIEATASTGGQFMPPVMGIVAFMMPAFLGISYFQVCLAALIPAILYYFAVFLTVHLESKKHGFGGLPREQLPRLSSALKPIWIIVIPIAVLVYYLWQDYPLDRVALYVTVLTALLSFGVKSKNRINPRKILAAFEDTARMTVTAGAACLTAGIIIGTFYGSGVGDKLSAGIISLSAGSLWPALLLTAVVCIILGMGVPTPVIYITMVITTIPALIKLGVTPIAAHMFTFFMGATSGITPPVCLTAFVAGSIAQASMMRTGWYACKLGIVAFLLPFLFTVRPELLASGPLIAIFIRTGLCIVGLFAFGFAFEGFAFSHLNIWQRVAFGAAGVLSWWPYSDLLAAAGATLCVGLVGIDFLARRGRLKPA